ncbi:condensation domain-containing protein, partial [Dyadobacter sp. OTU695]|uniref:condensation domain-containing protein n=1 Tax=Dyadobacter sp. OTU695 TaxID=3043860 RepID=UPI00313AE517
GDLFDSLFVFENYPVSKTLSETSWSITFEDIQASEHTNYPLDITIVADKDGILIKFNYNAGLLASGYVSAMLGHFHRAIRQIVGSGQQAKISEITILGG